MSLAGLVLLGQTTKHRAFIDSSCLDHGNDAGIGWSQGVSVELSPLDLAEVSVPVDLTQRNMLPGFY